MMYLHVYFIQDLKSIRLDGLVGRVSASSVVVCRFKPQLSNIKDLNDGCACCLLGTQYEENYTLNHRKHVLYTLPLNFGKLASTRL